MGLRKWLRDKHEESVLLMFEIPIVFARINKGAHHIYIDHNRLPYYLDLYQSDMIALQDAGLVQPAVSVKIQRVKIDYPVLALSFRQKLENGTFATKADLARSFGVSKAWITKVLKIGKISSN